MDNRAEVKEFLVSRRGRLTPDDVGITAGGNRRVAGLRRSEVAMLAGVSVEYYARLERGSLAGVSSGVLAAISDALRLDDAERAHLLDLARAADGSADLARPRRRPKRPWSPRPSLQWMLDSFTEGPAFVRNGRMDLLLANPLAEALYDEIRAVPGQPRNLARYNFLDPASRRFYPDWELAADTAVAILRTEAGRDPYNGDLHDLVGELSTRSDEFRTRWGAHDVRRHGNGSKRFHHHVIGDVTLVYEGLELVADPGLTMTTYTAEPGSPAREGLALLASWAASQTAETAARASAITEDA